MGMTDGLSPLFNNFFANRRTRKTIQNIERNNELRKNIIYYQPSEIEAFIERDLQTGLPLGSYIVSGGLNKYRARVAASVASCSIDQGIPVVVLHEGNIELSNKIWNETNFTNYRLNVSRGSGLYDPFYNRSAGEICQLVVNSVGANLVINAVGQLYLMGIIDFVQSKMMPPYFDMIDRCPYDQLLDKIDDSQQKGFIDDQRATAIRGKILQGQSERAGIQSFFSLLSNQGNGILSNMNTRDCAKNIRAAANHNGLIMIDIGSSTNEFLLNIICNEIREIIATGKRMMLILDGISICSNNLLSGIVKSLTAVCPTTLISNDVYSMLGSDDNAFNSLVGNACKCIVFSHPTGVSSTKWSEVFGYCDIDKVSQNMGQNQNYNAGYSYGSQYSISVTTAKEYIVKPEEIARLKPEEVYIFDKNAQELAFTTIIT